MHPNEKVIRHFHELQGRMYAGGPLDAVAEMLHEDVVWHVPGRSAIAGHHRGRQGVLDYFAKRRRQANASFQVHVREVVASDELVVQLAGGRAELGGRTREWETAGIFRVREGKIAECWLLPFDQYEFDEIWS